MTIFMKQLEKPDPMLNSICVALQNPGLIANVLQVVDTVDSIGIKISPREIHMWGGAPDPVETKSKKKSSQSWFSFVIPNTACERYVYKWNKGSHTMYLPKAPLLDVLKKCKRIKQSVAELVVSPENQHETPDEPFFKVVVTSKVRGQDVVAEHMIPQQLTKVETFEPPHGCNGATLTVAHCDRIMRLLKQSEPITNLKFHHDKPNLYLDVFAGGLEKRVRSRIHLTDHTKWAVWPCTAYSDKVDSGGFLRTDLLRVFQLWKEYANCSKTSVKHMDFSMHIGGLNYDDMHQRLLIDIPLFGEGQKGVCRVALNAISLTDKTPAPAARVVTTRKAKPMKRPVKKKAKKKAAPTPVVVKA